MSKSDLPASLLPSILDRLIDEEPTDSTEPLWAGSHDVGELMSSVRRDLEDLLNTRPTNPELIDEGGEISRSLLTYGIPDFSSLATQEGSQIDRVRLEVERAIAAFEPRLKEVEVQVHEPEERLSRKLRLTIHGILHVEPIQEPVEFNAEVETTVGACKVEAKS